MNKHNKRCHHVPRLQLYNDIHDSGTQTSKTILELAKMEITRDYSPDSLMSTPCDSLTNFDDEVFSDEIEKEAPRKHVYKRRQYVSREKTERKESNSSSKSLIEMFLAKSKTKNGGHESRARFLQQTSPLRYLPKESYSTLKSQSFVEPTEQRRFKVKEVRNCVVEKVEPKPVKYFSGTGRKKTDLTVVKETPKRASRFMCPTISSENKNKLPEVKCLNKLISPTRRGRSNSLEERRLAACKKKVPYIDQSQESCAYIKDKDSGFSDNKMLPTRKANMQIVDSKTSKALGKLPLFEEDLLKIDELSLNLSSEGDLTGSVRVSNSNSSIDNSINCALNKVRERDWSTALKGLAEVIDLCRSIDTDLMFPHMITVNQRLIELLRSSRSHVCRTACQAAGHLFDLVKDTRRPEFDDIVNILLFKTADANKFIRKDANLALDCMVTHLPTFHAVRTLCAKGPTHKNDLVRTATARLLVCAVVIGGTDNLLNQNGSDLTKKRLVVNMVKFLEDKNLEARKYGERLYKVLNRDANFETYLKRYLEKEDIVQMRRSLKLIEKRR